MICNILDGYNKEDITSLVLRGCTNITSQMLGSTWLRDEVRNLPRTYKCRYDAAADLIHIYAFIKFFFRIREYKAVTSPPVFISPLDLGPKYSDKLGSGFHEYRKTWQLK